LVQKSLTIFEFAGTQYVELFDYYMEKGCLFWAPGSFQQITETVAVLAFISTVLVQFG